MPYQRRQRVFAMFVLLMQFYTLYKQRQRQRREIEDISSKYIASSSNLDRDEVALLLSTVKRRNRRRVWAYARSTEWVRLVLWGLNLERGEFERNFRMTRNSFEQLHALLGII